MLLFKASPPIDSGEEEAIERNHLLVARRGREPGLTLERDGRARADCAAGRASCSIRCRAICELLDASIRSGPYSVDAQGAAG